MGAAPPHAENLPCSLAWPSAEATAEDCTGGTSAWKALTVLRWKLIEAGGRGGRREGGEGGGRGAGGGGRGQGKAMDTCDGRMY